MVSEKDLQSYLKVAASALPCREARKEFSSYVHNVAHDISIENPDADFATVASLLGTTPKQVAADFVESQSPQTISRWNRSAHRYKYGLQLLVGESEKRAMNIETDSSAITRLSVFVILTLLCNLFKFLFCHFIEFVL